MAPSVVVLEFALVSEVVQERRAERKKLCYYVPRFDLNTYAVASSGAARWYRGPCHRRRRCRRWFCACLFHLLHSGFTSTIFTDKVVNKLSCVLILQLHLRHACLFQNNHFLLTNNYSKPRV